jgi:hypothetical protein
MTATNWRAAATKPASRNRNIECMLQTEYCFPFRPPAARSNPSAFLPAMAGSREYEDRRG